MRSKEVKEYRYDRQHNHRDVDTFFLPCVAQDKARQSRSDKARPQQRAAIAEEVARRSETPSDPAEGRNIKASKEAVDSSPDEVTHTSPDPLFVQRANYGISSWWTALLFNRSMPMPEKPFKKMCQANIGSGANV
jgi:hypothetical protein